MTVTDKEKDLPMRGGGGGGEDGGLGLISQQNKPPKSPPRLGSRHRL